MAWRVSYWDKKGNLVVHTGFNSEEAAMARGAQDMSDDLVDAEGNFGILVDEYRPIPANIGVVIGA